MKTSASILAALGLSLGALPAQTVPIFLNYQGTITDGDGTPLGSTGSAPNFTAAPTNRKMIFRIFNGPNTTTGLLWSEEQTVTVSLGQFSILLGQGNEVVYTAPPAPDPRPDLHTVFTSGGDFAPNGPGRYLEIIVDNSDGVFDAADLPITPRQRLTTTAYSFRAMKADTVANGAITEDALATGSVTADKIPDDSLDTIKLKNESITAAKLGPNSVTSTHIAPFAILGGDLGSQSVDGRIIVDGSIGPNDMANNAVSLNTLTGNSVNSSKIVDGSINNWDIADGAISANKLNPASVGFWDVVGGGANLTRPSGNVGIGVANPSVTLDVNGTVHTTNVRARTGIPGSGGSNNNGYSFVGNGNTGLFSPAANELSLYTQNGERMRILPNGNIGIGTNTPEARLDVVGNSEVIMAEDRYNGYGHYQDPDGTFYPHGITNIVDDFMSTFSTRGERFLDYDGLNSGGLTRWRGPVGIRTDSWIATRMGLLVYSDRRIKKDLRPSSPAQDLAAIQRLKVTDYRMVDPSDGGPASRRGFIAQEVEEVIPGAVTRSTEFVPDIFSRATALDYRPIAKTLLVTLNKDHDLKTGEKVRLHVDGERLDLEVTAVPSARSFEVAKCETAPKAVFVYGRQVDDFRTVNYDHLFTTSIGALQELKREKDAEVLALQEENALLRSRLAALEANQQARDERLAAIEKLLSSKENDVRTVSLKAGQ